MATSPGWAQLGSTIAGGNKLNSALAYENGESLGAKTQDALAQARSRIDQNNALENIDSTLSGLPGLRDTDPDGPQKRAAYAGQMRAHIDPAQLANAQKTGQETDYRSQIVDPTTSDSDVARRLFALNQNHEIQKIGPDGQVVNELHPDQGVSLTPIGTAIAGQKQAQTAQELSAADKNRDQIAHPEKYRLMAGAPAPGSDGSQPVEQETYAQLVAQGLAPMPTAGRALIQMGGEDFARRVNFLAGQGKGGAQPPAAAPPVAAPPAAPGVKPPVAGAPPVAAPAGATPPAAGADTSGIVLPVDKPPQAFQANFDANTYGQRRTALNDLSRKNGTGGNDDALNRTAGHLDVYEQLMKNSGNTNFVAGNQLKNWYQQQTGKAWPGQASLAAHVLGTEIIKSMTSVGAGSAEERLGLADQFKNANGIDQAMGAITTAQDLLREQAVATNQRVTSSGVKDFYGKYLTPTTRRRLSLGEFEKAAAPAGATPAPAGGAPKVLSLEDYLKGKGF